MSSFNLKKKKIHELLKRQLIVETLLIVTLPSPVIIYWVSGEMKKKITQGLLVNLNLYEARMCPMKQSEIQKLPPSACSLPSWRLCHFFEAGYILMGETPEGDVNLKGRLPGSGTSLFSKKS